MNTAFIAGVGNTPFGRLEGQGPLDLMAAAARQALADAQLRHADIDGLLCGYATAAQHQWRIQPEAVKGLAGVTTPRRKAGVRDQIGQVR